MATSVRGGGTNGGRERRGTSPSSSPSLAKKSPKPSLSTPSPSSSSPTSGKTTPAVDRKQAPSYLRPTKSSKSLDSSMGPKKSNTDSSPQKPTPPRRRSFDRPPPASQVQKAIQVSPGAREARTLRSSSFSVKSTTSSPSSTRAGIERQSSLGKTPIRDRKVEPQLYKSRSLSRGNVASNSIPKGSTRLASKKKSPKSVTSESSNECDNQSVEHLVSDDDIGYTHNENQSLPEISEMPDSNEELKDPTNLEVHAKHVEEEQDHKEKGGEEEQHITLDENKDDHHDHEEKSTAVEEVTEEPAPQEIETPEKEEDQPVVEAQPEVHHVSADEKPTDDVHPSEVQCEEQSNQTGEGAGDLGETQEEPPKVDIILKEKEEEEEEEESPTKEAQKSEEKTEQVEEKEDQKQSVRRSSSPPVRPQPAGKKENQAYNDVIEQTASKLMGKKNKVLALAGAFETVISLQDTHKN